MPISEEFIKGVQFALSILEGYEDSIANAIEEREEALFDEESCLTNEEIASLHRGVDALYQEYYLVCTLKSYIRLDLHEKVKEANTETNSKGEE